MTIKKTLKKMIEANGGEITPHQVVEEARNPDHPLHKNFEWDNSIAAEKWRVQQARMMIKVVVETITIKGEEHEVNSFFSVVNENQERVYVTVETAITKPSYTNQLLSDCENYVTHFLRIIKLLQTKIK